MGSTEELILVSRVISRNESLVAYRSVLVFRNID